MGDAADDALDAAIDDWILDEDGRYEEDDGYGYALQMRHTCPKCKGPLVERTNRTTGTCFMGCRRFPRCRGTVPLHLYQKET